MLNELIVYAPSRIYDLYVSSQKQYVQQRQHACICIPYNYVTDKKKLLVKQRHNSHNYDLYVLMSDSHDQSCMNHVWLARKHGPSAILQPR